MACFRNKLRDIFLLLGFVPVFSHCVPEAHAQQPPGANDAGTVSVASEPSNAAACTDRRRRANTRLTTFEVLCTLHQHWPEVRRCRDLAPANDAGVPRILLSLRLDAEGRPTDVRRLGFVNTTGDVQTCIANQLRNWVFPPRGRTTEEYRWRLDLLDAPPPLPPAPPGLRPR